MDQNFVNEYIQQLANQVKALLMEKVILTTQNTLLTKQVDDLKKQVEELQNRSETSYSTTT